MEAKLNLTKVAQRGKVKRMIEYHTHQSLTVHMCTMFECIHPYKGNIWKVYFSNRNGGRSKDGECTVFGTDH